MKMTKAKDFIRGQQYIEIDSAEVNDPIIWVCVMNDCIRQHIEFVSLDDNITHKMTWDVVNQFLDKDDCTDLCEYQPNHFKDDLFTL